MGSLCCKTKTLDVSSSPETNTKPQPEGTEISKQSKDTPIPQPSSEVHLLEGPPISNPSPEVHPLEGPPISNPSPEVHPLEGPPISNPSSEGQPPEEPPISNPSPDEQPPEAPPPEPRNSKRALLCGVTYKKSKYELKGAINDVKNMRSLLIEKFGFVENNMRILTEEDGNPDRIPTKKNILEGLQWLVEGCCSGDSLVFYFAGHGIQQPDREHEERDSLNEAICPSDYSKEGVILDNDINFLIVWPLKKGVKLHAIIDSCHSGTMLDLLHVYNRKIKDWEDNSPLTGTRKGTDGGLAISISACQDSEEAADTSVFTGSNQMNGALTYILIEKIKGNQELTYGGLLDLIHDAIEDVQKDGRLYTTNFLKKIFGNKISQKPQLSSSETFDVYNTHFQL